MKEASDTPILRKLLRPCFDNQLTEVLNPPSGELGGAESPVSAVIVPFLLP